MQVSLTRMEICNQCQHKNGPTCGVCGCFLAAKTKCFSCECPLQKWTAFATQEDWDAIKQTVAKYDEGQES